MMHTYPVIAPDGKLTVVSNEGQIGVPDAMRIVGGRPELFLLGDGFAAYANGDGLRLGLPQNQKFTLVYGKVLIGRPDTNGGFSGLDRKQHRQINIYVRDALPLRRG